MKRLITLFAAAAMILLGSNAAKAQGFGGFGGEMPTPEQMAKMRVDRMKESLKLDDSQCAKLTEIFKKESEEMAKQMQGGMDFQSMDFDAIRKQMEERQAKQNAELKKILTADQFKKWEAEMVRMRENMAMPGF